MRRPEDLARHCRVEIGRGHRATGILAEAPGGAGVGLGDLLEHLDIGDGFELGAAQRARQQQAEKAARDQRLDDMFRKLSSFLDLIRSGRQHRREGTRAFHVIDAANLGAAQVE